uniref:Uncharacterized protein n=1 Tax=Myotis myotis TaxID=51298 RepID=A0A7J7VYM0_MYOMY|nr:hypothetical protein mMyoMyo1_012275 [Myotis myotis]
MLERPLRPLTHVLSPERCQKQTDCMKTVSPERDNVSKVTEQDSVTIPEWHHSLLLGDTRGKQGEPSGDWEADSPCPSSGEHCPPPHPYLRPQHPGLVLERVNCTLPAGKTALQPLKDDIKGGR